MTCGEGEVCATLIQHHRPDSGSCRHHQSYFIYLGGEIYFLIVCLAIDAQPAEAIANVVAWMAERHCVKMQIISE